MKKTLSLLLLVVLVGCSRRNGVDISANGKQGILYIEDSIQTIGVVSKQIYQKKTCYFELKNTGKFPVTIQDIDISCGCLSCDVPKQPIMPSKSIVLPITINLNNQWGLFNKSIVIFSNAQIPNKILRIKGQIIK